MLLRFLMKIVTVVVVEAARWIAGTTLQVSS
jgi:hypothetical protein